jgi:hypothetical protein
MDGIATTNVRITGVWTDFSGAGVDYWPQSVEGLTKLGLQRSSCDNAVLE